MSLARRRLSSLISLGLAVGLLLPTVVPVAAGRPTSDLPARIELPDGFQPEGIESDQAGNLYAGSLLDGAIWTADATTGRGYLRSDFWNIRSDFSDAALAALAADLASAAAC